MNKLPCFLAVLCVLLVIIVLPGDLRAGNRATLYFFYGKGCPHCAKEARFLDTLRKKYQDLSIKEYEVWHDPENAQFLVLVSDLFGVKPKGVPMTFIGSFDPISGYRTDEVTGKVIEKRISYCIDTGCDDPVARLLAGLRVPPSPVNPAREKEGEKRAVISGLESEETSDRTKKPDWSAAPSPETKEDDDVEKHGSPDTAITLPVVGKKDVSTMSLPAMTVILASLDSFNPCAFFVLFTLLGILVHAHSRKRMFLIGGIFVFFSGFIYFLFMSAWLNIFMHIGELMVITVIAGIIALIIASINIKDFFFFRKGVSLGIPEGAKPRLFERMRGLLKATSIFSLIIGTVVLAVVANTYELLCTVGFPIVFTRILTLNKLEPLQYYLYLVLYNVIYIIPLGVIVAMVSTTLGARKLTERQGQILKLVSGLMMLFLGAVLLINPALFNNIFVGMGLLVLALTGSWVIVRITGWRERRLAS